MVKVADNEKARRDIARLAELNILIPQGEYRHRRYYLNPSFL